jgi:hypothetical protein
MTHQIVGWMLVGIIPLVLIWVVVNWIHAGQTMDSITRERDFRDYEEYVEVTRPDGQVEYYGGMVTRPDGQVEYYGGMWTPETGWQPLPTDAVSAYPPEMTGEEDA